MAVIVLIGPRLLAGIGVTLGIGALAFACAGSEEETTAEPNPATGGSSGNDGGGGTGGTGGTSTGGTGGTSTGGTGGTAGTGGTGGSAGMGGTGGSGGGVMGGQCSPCEQTSDCDTDYYCLSDPQGEKFCAQDCTLTSSCPSAADECVDISSYDSSSGEPGKACVPVQSGSCDCTAEREDLQRTCFRTNSHGTCAGLETCTSGQWAGCDADLATPEACDGLDNDCNGLTDGEEPDLTGNDLCGGGMAPPHTSFECISGSCELGDCDDGWTKYPPSLPPTAGCACPVDTTDIAPATDDACSDAQDMGAVADPSGTLLLQGTLSSDTDSDWFAFTATDTNEVPAVNSYRVNIAFESPNGNPGGEFLFDVIRGSAANACTAATQSAITEHDWCADSSTIAADADSSAEYRVRVYRAAGATGSCNVYSVEVTNGGTGACPPEDACGADP